MFNNLILFLLGITLLPNLEFCSAIEFLSNEDKLLPCNLVWKNASLGSSYPLDAINANPEGIMQLIIRTKLPDGIGMFLGRVEPISLQAFIAHEDESNKAIPVVQFEVLSNSHYCNISWTSNPSSNLKVRMENNTNDVFVGRLNLEQQWLPGQIQFDQIKVPINETESLVVSYNLQYLQSYSDGLELEITDIVMDNDVPESVEFVGEDIIKNKADTTIKQTLIHKKTIKETTNFTLSETWTSTKTTKVKKLFRKTKTSTSTSTIRLISTIITEEYKEINLSREIIIPPFSSLRACSLIKMAKGFTTPYSAVARYRAKGLPAFQVWKILQTDNLDLSNAFFINDDVAIPIRDTMSGTLSMSSSFALIELGSRDCTSLIF